MLPLSAVPVLRPAHYTVRTRTPHTCHAATNTHTCVQGYKAPTLREMRFGDIHRTHSFHPTYVAALTEKGIDYAVL